MGRGAGIAPPAGGGGMRHPVASGGGVGEIRLDVRLTRVERTEEEEEDWGGFVLLPDVLCTGCVIYYVARVMND